jgi:hypothetical protein
MSASCCSCAAAGSTPAAAAAHRCPRRMGARHVIWAAAGAALLAAARPTRASVPLRSPDAPARGMAAAGADRKVAGRAARRPSTRPSVRMVQPLCWSAGGGSAACPCAGQKSTPVVHGKHGALTDRRAREWARERRLPDSGRSAAQRAADTSRAARAPPASTLAVPTTLRGGTATTRPLRACQQITIATSEKSRAARVRMCEQRGQAGRQAGMQAVRSMPSVRAWGSTHAPTQPAMLLNAQETPGPQVES